MTPANPTTPIRKTLLFLGSLIGATLALTALAYAPWPLWVNVISIGLVAVGLGLDRRLRPLAAGTLMALVGYAVFFLWLFSQFNGLGDIG